MIDTHCHLLPGLDDGPRSQAEAIRMARRLVQFGIREVVCTPHFSHRYPISVATATARHDELRHALSMLGVELGMHLAAEINPELVLTMPAPELASRALPAGYAIIELVSSTPRQFPLVATRRLAEIGLLPVFAHPERCLAIQTRPDLLDEVRAAGALVQVVGPSLLAQRQRAVTSTAWGLIDSGRADLLASDAHRASGTGVQLGPLGDLVRSRYGASTVEALTITNPERLLRPADQ